MAQADNSKKSDKARSEEAEKPGTDEATHEHDDELADEWGKESFPSSDPPGHY